MLNFRYDLGNYVFFKLEIPFFEEKKYLLIITIIYNDIF